MVLASLAWAVTVNLVASKDNTLYEMANHPDLSSGHGDSLFMGGIAQLDPDNNAYRRRALIQFDLSSIPAGATINSVGLRVQVTRTTSASYLFDVRRMLASWGEGASVASGQGGQGAPAQPGDVTWNYRFFGTPDSAWITPGGDFDPTVLGTAMVGSVGSYTFTGAGMTSCVQGWLDGTVPNDGWMLTSDLEFLSTIAKRIASRENTNSSYRPTLMVTYTPRPPGSCVADFNGDGAVGTDADIEAFFACLGGSCCPTCGSADFNGDGSIGTDADIESFFRVLAGQPC
jgi:hypothetical protein